MSTHQSEPQGGEGPGSRNQSSQGNNPAEPSFQNHSSQNHSSQNYSPRDQKPDADLGAAISARAAGKVQAREDGSLDVMASVGGVRGLVEATLPAAAFMIAFVVAEDLTLAIAIAVGLGVVFALVRLVQRGSLVQSLSGLAVIVLCAFVAQQTGEARDFYLWGFVTNGAYIIGFVVSIVIRWPFLGVLFGLVRGEGFDWRQDKVKLRRYTLATWIVTAVLVARIAVQVPLYLADDIVALGTTRLIMGLPLYALALWVGWMMTRPQAVGERPERADR